MAGKVNTRFVVMLSAGMVAMLVAAVAVGLFIKSRTGPDLIKKGDAALAAKDWDNAEKYYSRAVNKDQTNIAYLEKWLNCFATWVPPTQPVYVDKYRNNYRMVKRQIALLKRTDIAAHREYLDLLWVPMKTQGVFIKAAVEQMNDEVTRSLGLFVGDPKEKGEAQALRGYRGESLVRLMADPGAGLKDDEIKLAKDDLEAAMKAEPNNADLAVALMNWYMLSAEKLKKSDRLEQATKMEADGLAVLNDFLAKHPDDPEALLNKLVFDADKAQTAAMKDKSGLEMVTAARQAVAPLKVKLQGLADAYRKAGKYDRYSLKRLRQVEGVIDENAKFATTLALAEEAIAKNPNDGGMILMAAQCAADRGDVKKGVELMERVVALPQLPISFEGVREFDDKREATFYLAKYVLQDWEQSTDDKQRAALLEKAKKYRTDLIAMTGEDALEVVFVDAMIKFAEQDWVNAKRLLIKYNDATKERDMAAMWTLARVELQLNNTGAARQILDRMIKELPGFSGPLIYLAQIENNLNNTKGAIRILEKVLAAEPDNKLAIDLLDKYRIASGEKMPEDPAQRFMSEANKLLNGDGDKPGSPEAAIAKLKDGMKTIKNPKLPIALTRLHLELGQIEEAKEVINAAAKEYPAEERIKEIVRALESKDPLGDAIKAVDASSDPPLEKAWKKFQIYSKANRDTEATAALLEAEKIDPTDQRVLERSFLIALRNKDWAGAESRAKLAEQKDIDKLGGKLFKARLLAAQEQYAEAATLLQDLANNKIADVESLHLLGRLYAQLGRFDDAELAFKDARRLRANDLPTMIDYIKLLAQQQKNAEALTIARQSEQMAADNPEFVDLLLNLEASVGDRTGAMTRREAIMKREPTNMINKLALARLKVDLKRWDEAMALMDELRKFSDELDIAELEAKFFTDRKEPEEATKRMEAFIARHKPEELGHQPYVSFGQFLISQRRLDEGIKMMERGRPYQNPKVMEVDRLIADTLASANRSAEAAEIYQKIVDAGADGARQEVRTRLTEILVQLQRYDDALKQLDQVKPSTPQAALALMRADIAVGKGDDKGARDLFARAIQDFPADPLVYMRRAQWHLSRGKEGVPEAMQDLGAAIRVKPTFSEAYRLRSRVYVSMGETDKAITDLREAVKVNPNLEELRLGLMRELIRLNRAGEAAEVADEALRLRPNEINVALACASVFSASQDWPRAQRYLKIAWDIDHRPDIALLYIDAILTPEGGNPAQAEAILNDPAIIPKVPSSASFIVARARIFAKRNRAQEAARDVVTSMQVLALDDPSAVLAWWSEVRKVAPKGPDAASLMDRNDIPAKMRDWSRFFLGSALGETPATKSRAISVLGEVVNQSQDKAIQLMAYRQRGTILYQQGREIELVKGGGSDPAKAQFTEAAKAWVEGVTKFPEDMELNNNLAYVLSKHLGKFVEAQKYAEKAVEISGENSDALDTLGFIYLSAGQLDKAEETFKRANVAARSNAARVPVALHFGQLFVLRGKKDEAKGQLTVVERIIQANPELEKPYKSDIDELRRKIDSL